MVIVVEEMKKLVIVNVGAAAPEMVEKYGDFEVIAKSHIEKQGIQCELVSGIEDTLPPAETLAGVIIMGSPAMVTERKPWMLRLSQQIVELVNKEVPLLGICFGHQLIAQALGGEVNFHPQGLEVGTVSIEKTAEADKDALFSQLPISFNAQVIHYQTVVKLPPNAVRLAHNSFESNHAYRVGKSTWGLQFHPEFDSAIMHDYLITYRDNQKLEQAYQPLAEKVECCLEARKVLLNFAQFCSQNSSVQQKVA